MNDSRVSAWVIVLGSLIFMAAAFSPISRVFAIRDAAEKLEIIGSAPTQWTIAQILFALGALVTAVGVALLAYRLSGQDYSRYLHGSSALMITGALFWTWHVYLRATDPMLFTSGAIPLWLFAVYSLLTIAALALMGYALLQAGGPAWLAWTAMGGAMSFLVLGLAFGDMPPFVYYLVTLAIGVTLLRLPAAAAVPG